MRICLMFLLIICAVMAQSAIKMPEAFSDGMVLQRDMAVPVWGTATPDEKITVTFCEQEISAITDRNGKWRVELKPLKAGGPWPMTIMGTNTIKYNTVYVGDVWLCYGQSNMQWENKLSTTAEQTATETSELIRLLHVHRKWQPATGVPLADFSAVAYFFGKSLQAKLQIPIGLIYGGEGGTPAEFWMPKETLHKLGYSSDFDLFYTDRLVTIQPFAIKGAIWYQGESNVGRDREFPTLMTALIDSWRKAWGQGDFPFLFVQLARIGGAQKKPQAVAKDGWALLRNAQTSNLKIPNTGMVVCYDTTDGNIHPPNKQPVGERLALLARNMVYDEKPAEDFRSPILKHVTRKENTVTISFEYADKGLITKDSVDNTVKDISMVFADNTVKPAKAKIVDKIMEVDLTRETGLPDIYYAWNNFPQGNIFNKAELPVSPFALITPRYYIDSCKDDKIILKSSSAFDLEISIKPSSYKINGFKVLKAEIVNQDVRLTLDHKLSSGDKFTLNLPGFHAWDGITPISDIQCTVLPGRLAYGDIIQECLIGEVKENIDPATVLKEEVIDAITLRPEAKDPWKLAVPMSTGFDIVKWAGNLSNAVAFAHVYIYSYTDRKVQLWVGSDDSIKVYVNGSPVFTSLKTHGMGLDQDKIPDISLKKGWNTLLMEVCQSKGGWGVAARIMGSNGEIPTGISYQAEAPAEKF